MDSSGALSPQHEGAQAVLVVDDDTQVLRFVTRMLSSLGFSQVFQASSAREALEIWGVHRGEIQWVVSDFVMPEVTGDQMAVEMLRAKPELKVLFISGNDPNSLDSAIPLSGGNFLQKPFTVSDIRRSMANLSFPA